MSLEEIQRFYDELTLLTGVIADFASNELWANYHEHQELIGDLA